MAALTDGQVAAGVYVDHKAVFEQGILVVEHDLFLYGCELQRMRMD